MQAPTSLSNRADLISRHLLVTCIAVSQTGRLPATCQLSGPVQRSMHSMPHRHSALLAGPAGSVRTTRVALGALGRVSVAPQALWRGAGHAAAVDGSVAGLALGAGLGVCARIAVVRAGLAAAIDEDCGRFSRVLAGRAHAGCFAVSTVGAAGLTLVARLAGGKAPVTLAALVGAFADEAAAWRAGTRAQSDQWGDSEPTSCRPVVSCPRDAQQSSGGTLCRQCQATHQLATQGRQVPLEASQVLLLH